MADFDPNIIPFYHDSNRAWGAVKRILAIPCAIPAVVYMEAFAEAAWGAAQAYVGPDPKEYYHQALGQSFYHDAKQVIRDVQIFGHDDTNPVLRTVFKLADLFDIKAWYLFNFGTAVDGLVDFSTQIQKMTGCQYKGDNRYQTGSAYINAIGDDGAFYGDDFSMVSGSGTQTAGPCAYEVKNGQSGFAAATCGFADFNNIPVASSTGVICANNGMIMDLGSNDPTVENGQRVSHTWFQNKSDRGTDLTYEVMSSYNGGVPLPLGEAFRDGDHWHGYCYNASRTPK